MLSTFKLCSNFSSGISSFYRSGLTANKISQLIPSPNRPLDFFRFASATTKKVAPNAKKSVSKKPVTKKPVAKTSAVAKATPKNDKIQKVSKEKINKAKEAAVLRKKKDAETTKQLKEKQREKQRREKEKEEQQRKLEKIKEQKQKEKEKKAARPKRAKSAYVLFMTSSFAAVKKVNPNDRASDIAKKIGKKWNSMSDAEKKPFVEEAKKDAERYLKDKAEAAKLAPPKRPLSAFMLYTQEKRDGVVKANPNLKIQDVARSIGQKWTSAPQSEKDKYIKQANKLKADFVRKYGTQSK